ncbi:sigma-70 family RNA polymerase sigma factor [Tolypothrix sp. VBCCA 56010]|uniref:sigma-70 family RNA polymerase sigma factor n=1 Tax=Tolypothrix sp. VBCCA 56010 TaxID=3137731 RepID=UPI003D7D5DB4
MFTITPKLPSRQNLVDKFSMYMTVENNKGRSTIKWKTDPHLQSNIELYKSRHKKFASLFNQENNGRDLVQFWIDMAFNDLPALEEWEPEKRVQNAWEHLSVYCEESCYWAAEKLSSDVWKEDKYQSWEEYLFFARCLIYNYNKFRYVLAKYNSNNSLDTYLTTVLINAIKDEAAVAKFSKWRLLHKKSDRELKEALVRAGRYEPEISQFLFARKYFKQVYQMNKIQNPAKITGKKWLEPDSADFAEAANYYNAEKLLPSVPHEVAAGAFVTGEQIKVWMEICIIALQNYPKSITPHFSLEALQETGRKVEYDESPEIIEQDLLTYSEVKDSFETQGRTVKRTEPALLLQLLFFKSEQQEILLLYYGFGLNQKQIAEKFKVTQGAIARRLQTIELKLLKTLSELSQPTEWVSQYVAGWLGRSYQAPIYSDLIHVAIVEAIKKLEPQEQELLRLTYGQKLDEQIIANQLGISQPKLIDTLRRTKSKLEAALIKEIDNLINKYLQSWLPKVSKTVVKSACDNLGFSRSGAASLKTMNAVLKESLKILHSSK